MLRICRKCGKEYTSYPESSLCPTCVAEAKKTTLRTRYCRTCGASFAGGPRAWYCPNCRKERERERNRRHKRNGPARLLGSIDQCIVCGGDYVVSSGLQKYCPACAPAEYKAIDNAQSKAWNAAHINPDDRRILRQSHAAEIQCAVCGKAFVPTSAAITCSKACSGALAKTRNSVYHKTHRPELRAKKRDQAKARLDAMTDEEREAYRLEKNRRARENYRKRKERAEAEAKKDT